VILGLAVAFRARRDYEVAIFALVVRIASMSEVMGWE
jgi:hypothetical protein